MFRCFLFGKFELVDMYCAYALLVCDVGVALRCENNFVFHLDFSISYKLLGIKMSASF